MKIFKIITSMITLASIIGLAAIVTSCSPDTADTKTQQDSADNVSEAETYGPIARVRRRG